MSSPALKRAVLIAGIAAASVLMPKQSPPEIEVRAKGDVGLALEGITTQEFLSQGPAKKVLADITELVEVDLPEVGDKYERGYGLRNSFRNAHATYLCLAREDAPSDTFTRHGVTYVIGANPYALFESTVRSVPAYAVRSATGSSLEPLVGVLERPIDIAIGLDGVSRQYAKGIIERVKRTLSDTFNISLRVHGMYMQDIGERFSNESEWVRLKAQVGSPCDVYLVLTSWDWRDLDNPHYPLTGESVEAYGFAWIETTKSSDLVVNTILHELAHLFGADHDYLKTSIMNPYHRGQDYFWPTHAKRAMINGFPQGKGKQPEEGDR